MPDIDNEAQGDTLDSPAAEPLDMEALFQQQLSGGSEDVPDETEDEQEDTPEQIDETPSADAWFKPSEDGSKLIIGDQEYTQDDLQASLLRQADYTRKTQELSEQRKAVQPLIEAEESLKQLPEDARQRVFEALEREVRQFKGEPEQTQAEQPGTIAKMLEDGGYDSDLVKAVSILETNNANLLKQVQALSGAMPEIQGFVREQRGDIEAKAAAEAIKQAYGANVTPEQVREAQKATGVQDMEAAWLKVHASKLMQQRAAAPAQASKPPQAPSPSGNTFVIQKDTTPDEIFNAVISGQQVKRQEEIGK